MARRRRWPQADQTKTRNNWSSCLTCRHRKVDCDKAKPSCSNWDYQSHSESNLMYLRIDLSVVSPTWNDSSVKEPTHSLLGKVFYCKLSCSALTKDRPYSLETPRTELSRPYTNVYKTANSAFWSMLKASFASPFIAVCMHS